MKEHLSLEEILQDLTPLFEQYASKDNIITEHNVHKHENSHIRAIVHTMIEKLLLENSKMYPSEHIAAFMEEIDNGKKGIILAEHYSNMDLPILLYLMEQTGDAGKALSKRSISIAGMKLTEEDARIAALTEGYERIVIYPSRSLAGITDPDTLQAEQKRSRSINLAAMKALEEARQAGKVIIVFPAGTRYRPGKPETKRGVREIDSYIRSADVMLLVSINGNCLRISDDPANMTEDVVVRDTVIMEVSPVIHCADFRERAKQQCGEHDDKKQAVVDMVMAELEQMHNRNEQQRS
ncbi:MAG: 1-acyl-sn-glycerol-3-phosphate acyltransferase [Treponema sp.]